MLSLPVAQTKACTSFSHLNFSVSPRIPHQTSGYSLASHRLDAGDRGQSGTPCLLLSSQNWARKQNLLIFLFLSIFLLSLHLYHPHPNGVGFPVADPSGYSLCHAGKIVLWKSDLSLHCGNSPMTTPNSASPNPNSPQKTLWASIRSPLEGPRYRAQGIYARTWPTLPWWSGIDPSFTYQDQSLAYSQSPIS